MGLENEVRFMGSRPDPRLFFWAADAFVMPSLYEGLGNSALEAIASGCPAVLSHGSGLKEIANETKWAISVNPAEESIAAGLLHMAGIPAQTRQMHALEDSDRIRERFSMDRGVRVMIENLYVHPFAISLPSIQDAHKELA